MPKKIVFATNNLHKLEEVQHLLGEDFQLSGLAAIGCKEDIPEPHPTLEENAVAKAAYVFTRYGLPCFADDTGLEVDALGGTPGVLSARYAGEDKDPAANMDKLLSALDGHSDRKARFRTVIAYVSADGTHLFEGIVNGRILTEKRGSQGFGYDPVFLPDGYELSFAEMPLEMKNRLSHRARAMRKLMDFLHPSGK
jgi:XTP/dITP diphosphohydrolase